MRHGKLQRAGFPTLIAISTAIAATLACSPAVAQTQDGPTPTIQTSSPDPEPYCFGVGCPCGNDAPAAGCANSSGNGVRLQSYGSTSVAANDLTLSITDLGHGSSHPYMIFMGGARSSVPFGDGLLCVGPGATGLVRVKYNQAGAVSGSNFYIRYWNHIAGENAEILAGSTWFFQVWYRDPAGPCRTGFNLTNALKAQFVP